MNSQWLLFIFLVGVIILAVDITRRAVFAIINDNNEQKIRRSMRRLRKPTQPWVTVLIYGKNQASELEKTVRQVRRSQYGPYDIVAVNDLSNSDTAIRIKRYIDKVNNRVKIQFLQRRIAGTKLDAYRAAYRKSQRGKIIVCLNAGDRVDKLLLKRAVVLRTGKQSWQVKTHVTTESYGVAGIAKSLRALFWNHPSTTQVYTPAALRRSKAPGYHINFSSILWIQVLLLGVIILGIVYGGIIVLWYAWLLFSVYLLALIWIQYETPVSEKWKFSFTVPSAFFLIPVVSFTEGIAQLHIRK